MLLSNLTVFFFQRPTICYIKVAERKNDSEFQRWIALSSVRIFRPKKLPPLFSSFSSQPGDKPKSHMPEFEDARPALQCLTSRLSNRKKRRHSEWPLVLPTFSDCLATSQVVCLLRLRCTLILVLYRGLVLEGPEKFLHPKLAKSQTLWLRSCFNLLCTHSEYKQIRGSLHTRSFKRIHWGRTLYITLAVELYLHCLRPSISTAHQLFAGDKIKVLSIVRSMYAGSLWVTFAMFNVNRAIVFFI